MLDVSSRLADDKKSDIRIEAAIAKLYASEMGWQVVDELMQIRGGRGYETAESLKARGEKPVPVEQALRDMRINRIFEGSTEIMHLLIAREAVDKHLEVAGEILEGDGDLGEGQGRRRRGEVLRQVAAAAGGRRGPEARRLRRVRLARDAPALRRAQLAQARPHDFYAMGRWQAKLEKKQAFLGRIVDIGAELFAISVRRDLRGDASSSEHPERGRDAYALADLFCKQARPRAETSSTTLWSNDDDDNYASAQDVLEGRYTWIEEGVVDPSGDGPMIAGQPEAPAEVPVAAEVH